MEKLKKWMIDEIKFTTSESDAEEMAKLMVKGSMKPVWSFIAERIRLKSEVQIIRGNLKLLDEKQKSKVNSELCDEDDNYELGVIDKSLLKTKKRMTQLEHDIKRLQLICGESNSAKDELKQRLKKSASSIGQVVEQQAKVQRTISQLKQKTSQVNHWIEDLNSNKNEAQIQATLSEIKPMLMEILKDGQPCILDEGKFISFLPSTLIQEVKKITRSVSTDIRIELDKPDSKPPKDSNVEKVLEELYASHLESHQKLIKASQTISLLEAESDRLFTENIPHEEALKRLIQLKQTKKTAQAIQNELRAQIKQQSFVPLKDDIPQAFAIVEQQNKDILCSKLIIEELLSQASGHSERVLSQVHLNNDQRQKLNIDIDYNINFGTLSMYNPVVCSAISIDRCLDQRLNRLGPLIDLMWKPDLNCILKTIADIMLKIAMKKSLSNEMREFEQCSDATTVLKRLHKELLRDEERTANLIQHKKEQSANRNNACMKLLHAIKIWSQEPAKEAYSKSMGVTYQKY